jgi:two-component system CheB/CheR fusion protein
MELPLVATPTANRVRENRRPAKKRRVLVIEDNVDTADTLKAALSLYDHQVEVAYDGVTGLELARKFRPEIVICDIGLPRMDGYEVARAFRSDAKLRGTYLVALSGYAQMEDRRRAAIAGFNDHVAKPASVEALDRVLAQMPNHRAT